MQNIPNDSQQSRDRDDKKRGQQQPDQIPCDKDIESLSKDKQIDASIDAVDDVVPVVVRPGHIRFEVLGQGLLLSHVCSDIYSDVLLHLSLIAKIA